MYPLSHFSAKLDKSQIICYTNEQCKIQKEFAMSKFEEFLVSFLERKVEPPVTFGSYHFICLLLTVLLTVFLVWRFRNTSDKTIRILLFAVWCTVVTLEILKQIEGAFYVENGVPTWQYLWHYFPLQFCSTIHYTLPFIVFLPDGFIRRTFIAFFTSFSFFAGLVVMIYPGDVYCGTLFINLQTMIHHGLMFAVGILMVAYNRKHMNKRYFAGSLVIFYTMAIIALVLNETLYEHYINLFFISRHYDCTLPLLSNIYKAVPYGWYFVIYFLGFTLVAFLVYLAEKGVLALIQKCNRQKHTA